MVRKYPNSQRFSKISTNTTSFYFIGMVGPNQLVIFYIVFVIRWKREIQIRFKYTDYTHPNIIRINQIIHIHICYTHPKVLIFQYSMQRDCSVQQVSFFAGFNSLSPDKNSNKKCKWLKLLTFFYKTLYFRLNPYYLLNI